MKLIYWVGVVGTVIIAVSLYWPIFFYIFLFVLYSLILVALAIFGTIYVHYKLTAKETTPVVRDLPSNVLYNATRSQLFDPPSPPKTAANLPIIFGRTVDSLLQQIIGNAMRDVVGPALGEVVANPRRIVDLLKEDIWLGIEKLHERASRIDAPKMIACDFVIKATVHLEKIRIAQARAAELGTDPVFGTSSYLTTPEKELEFLKKICEILIIFLLPRGYSLSPIKDLLSEVISFKVLFPVIKLVTSPDFINQQIVECIETKLVTVAIHRRSFEYAANFEDFLKIINSSQTTNELHSIRGSIVSDIMQATTVQNLQRTRGFDSDFSVNKMSSSGCSLGGGGDSENGPTRAEVTASLKLKKYIQQLSFAKNQCEKCLSRLGWDGNVSNDMDLSILDILSTVAGRRHFTVFLEPMRAASLVGFYTTVEELKHAPKGSWHQLGAEIFYTYIRCPNSEIPVDKATRKKMESFLVGDSGPEVFYEVQRECLVTMEDKYYQPFLLSEEYARLKNSLTQDDLKEITLNTYISTSADSQDETASNASSASGDVDPLIMDLSNHSTYARNKLEQLDEKLSNKNQALEALKQSLKPDSKLLQMLEKEIDWLRGEKRQLESHLLRTEVWGEYLGKWRAIVESVDLSDDKEPQPQFMIVVQVDEMNDCGKEDVATAMDAADSISTGWVVLRTLAQFHELHKKLRPMCAELKTIDLPANNLLKLFLFKNDKTLLEKTKEQVQKYLSFVLEDEHLHQSEALYEFLSPSSERLKQGTTPSPSKKQSKFSLATLFKHNSEKLDQFWGPHFRFNTADFVDDDQVSMYLEGSSGENGSSKSQVDLEAKDSIAEPLYALLGEIFDMGGVFKWLRRSLITFVQITYGQTINRQIRESINYLFEETMLHTYASTVLKVLWPGGVFTIKNIDRSEDQQEMTAIAAKSLLLDNIPDLLCNIIGAQNARTGILKLFDVVQNPIYNKQLFYDLLEIIMLELFPEIRQLKVPPSVTAVAVVGGSTSSATSTPTHGGHVPIGGLSTMGGSTHSTPTRFISRN
ncbi:sorting nexin-25 [Toxorhynchites rutilus septentrionalis]|uniref:sorting nexin-25 n=1 Tax=Toxorhynchites rutilus septentrionalis TaxID=329112 RepID=UPI0024791743|nr:sorting nexin-25 [Toxorhynchites rutilus septentrionalis]